MKTYVTQRWIAPVTLNVLLSAMLIAVMITAQPAAARDNPSAWEHCYVTVCGDKYAQCIKDCVDSHDGGRDAIRCMRQCHRGLKQCERSCESLKDPKYDDLDGPFL